MKTVDQIHPFALYEPAEFAELIGRNRKTIVNRLTKGTIRGQKVFGSWRVPGAEILRLIGQRPRPVAAPVAPRLSKDQRVKAALAQIRNL